MAAPFIGEIRSFGFNFAPTGWAQCNGQLLSISQFEVVFAVIGTTYGGNGTSNFALPNLQGQIPMHWGTGPGLNTTIGQPQGSSMVTLTMNQLPAHNHLVSGAKTESTGEATGVAGTTSFLGPASGHNTPYLTSPSSFDAPFSSKAISQTGGSQPHENMQPYLVLNFCMALEGIFPSRN